MNFLYNQPWFVERNFYSHGTTMATPWLIYNVFTSGTTYLEEMIYTLNINFLECFFLVQFVLDFPDEYIKSVEATYDKPNLFQNTVITSLTIKTSKGRTSSFGYTKGKKFVLEQKDCPLVGFHGKVGDAIDALGAYFAPLVPAKKLPSVGGNGGVAWDDGVYDGVRKIYVGQGNDGVSFVKFEYTKGTELVSGDEHGKATILGAEEVIF